MAAMGGKRSKVDWRLPHGDDTSMTPRVRFAINFASGTLTALMTLFSSIMLLGLLIFSLTPLQGSRGAAYIAAILMPLGAGMALLLYRNARPPVALAAISSLLAADILLIAHANRFFW